MSVLPSKKNQNDSKNTKLPTSCCWKYSFAHNEFYFNNDFVDHFGLKNQNYTSLDVWENLLTEDSFKKLIHFFKDPSSTNGKQTFECNPVKFPNQKFSIEIRAIDMVNPTTPGNMICRIAFKEEEEPMATGFVGNENHRLIQGVYKRFFYNSKQPIIIIEKNGSIINMNETAKAIIKAVLGNSISNMKEILTKSSLQDLEENLKNDAQFLLKLKFIESLKKLNDINWHVHPSVNFCYMIGE